MEEDTTSVMNRLDESFSTFIDRQAKAAEAAAKEAANQPEPYVPVDIYQRNQDARIEEFNKKRPRGSSTLVKAVTQSIINGDGVPGAGLAVAYKRAEDDIDFYKKKGERDRADIARNQYMDEKFIPAVEAVVNYTTPDEVLNCKEALSALDKYALVLGNAKGYTASYIRSAYSDLLGQDLYGDFDNSDQAVKEAVCRIKLLADTDQIRTAVGVAKQLKKQVDNGEHMASNDDYELIGRVAAFGD